MKFYNLIDKIIDDISDIIFFTATDKLFYGLTPGAAALAPTT